MRKRARIIPPGILDCSGGIPALEFMEGGTILYGGYTRDELVKIVIDDPAMAVLLLSLSPHEAVMLEDNDSRN